MWWCGWAVASAAAHPAFRGVLMLAFDDMCCYCSGMGNDTYVTRQEAARIAFVHLRTIDRWLDDGTLTRHQARKGRAVRIKRAELDELITPVPTTNDS